MGLTSFLIENFGIFFATISTAVSTLFAVKLGREKKKLEHLLLQKQVEENTLDVTAKNMSLYQNLMDDIKTRFEGTIEEYRNDVERLKVLLEESRETIGRQELFLKEKNEELNRLRGILVQNKIEFKQDEG